MRRPSSLSLVDVILWALRIGIVVGVSIGVFATLSDGKLTGENWRNLLIFGISSGSVYALIALGYTLVYGVLLMINFAHGDIFMFGGMTAFFVADFLNDAGFLNSDAAFSANGNLEALPYWSLMAGLTHRWSDAFRSTVTYGYVNLDNSSGQAATFYHTSHYASANVVWQLRKRLSVGLEGLYGLMEARNGVDSGDHWRVQVGMVYSLFD